MPIKVTCSNCGGVLHAPDDAGGKRGRCPTCGNILPIPAVGGGGPAPAVPAPPPEPPKPAAARQSFGDFAFGDKAAKPARADTPPRPVAEPRRQSADLAPPDEPPRRAAKPRPTSPFAKPGLPPAAADEADAADGTARAWRKARGGLWWVRTGVWFLLIPVLGLNGLRLFEHFNKEPLAYPGVLHQSWLPAAQELDVAVLGVPLFLALVFLVFGRLSFSGVPRKSGGRGLALFSALATLTVLLGLIAVLFPVVSAVATGVTPPVVINGEWQLFLTGETLGWIQRFGLTVGFAAFLVGEFWFVSALGRAASALGNTRFGGRVTRFTLLMGVTAGVLLSIGAVRPDFGADVKKTTEEVHREAAQQWATGVAEAQKAVGADFAHWSAVRDGTFLLAGLLVGVAYLRMVGAGRRAIREWLEENQPEA